NSTATSEFYTLSLHDALPIFGFVVLVVLENSPTGGDGGVEQIAGRFVHIGDFDAIFDLLAWRKLLDVDQRDLIPQLGIGCALCVDRKSTRLNSSHRTISYAVF